MVIIGVVIFLAASGTLAGTTSPSAGRNSSGSEASDKVQAETSAAPIPASAVESTPTITGAPTIIGGNAAQLTTPGPTATSGVASANATNATSTDAHTGTDLTSASTIPISLQSIYLDAVQGAWVSTTAGMTVGTATLPSGTALTALPTVTASSTLKTISCDFAKKTASEDMLQVSVVG